MSERTQHTDLEDCDDCDEKNGRIRALEARAEKAEATRDQLLELLKKKEGVLQKVEAALAAEQKAHHPPVEGWTCDAIKRAAGRESGRSKG